MTVIAAKVTDGAASAKLMRRFGIAASSVSRMVCVPVSVVIWAWVASVASSGVYEISCA